MKDEKRILGSHALKVALVRPQIAPNTGNIGRLYVATGVELHIVRPMGFVLSDKEVRRSGMDYWERLKLTMHDDEEAFLREMGEGRLWLFTSKGEKSFWEAEYQAGDCLVFGSETHGLSDEMMARYPERRVRIPQVEGERCLNLATAAGIGVYESLRQIHGARPQF